MAKHLTLDYHNTRPRRKRGMVERISFVLAIMMLLPNLFLAGTLVVPEIGWWLLHENYYVTLSVFGDRCALVGMFASVLVVCVGNMWGLGLLILQLASFFLVPSFGRA